MVKVYAPWTGTLNNIITKSKAMMPCGLRAVWEAKVRARAKHQQRAVTGDVAGEPQVFLMMLIRVWFQSAHMEET